MSHHHHHHHHATPHAGPQSLARIRTAFWLNVIFTMIEFAGGLWTGSVAVLADAVHDLGDSLALGLAYGLEKRANKGPTRDFSYGLRRLSLLSAAMTGVVLCGGSILIARESVERLLQPPSQAPDGLGMAALAILGLLVNGVAAWRMMKGETHNEKMLTWHLIEDVLGWVAVLIGALFIAFAKWTWLDPVLALLIAGFVGYNAIRNLVEVVLVFLQRMPQDFEADQLKQELLKIAGVSEIHDLHVWSLDGEKHVVTLHAVIDSGFDVVMIKKEIRHLAGHYGSVHTTIETELTNEDCGENCDPAVSD